MSLTISAKDWSAYIKKLKALNEKAAGEMKEYVRRRGFSDMNSLIEYAYGLVTKYGEGAATLTVAMYDAIAEMSGKLFDPAVPAETASYSQVEKTVRGVTKGSKKPETVGNAVGRLVKQAGADTMLQNALRDGAEFAWVPSGDTCAFCLVLASRGWQKASRKAIKNGHAEHIHSNCDCTYAIRFDKNTNVEGYEPEKYLAMYNAADGSTPREKINAMRRQQYAENKDEINAQKRAAYAEQKDHTIPIKGVKELKEYIAPNGNVYKVHGNKVVLDHTPHEREIAEILNKELGEEIYLVPRVNDPPGVRTPDYLIQNKSYDLKTLKEGAGENTIFNRIKKSSNQSKNFVIDVSVSGLRDEVIDEQLNKVFWSQNTQFVDKVIIIKDKKVYRTKERK